MPDFDEKHIFVLLSRPPQASLLTHQYLISIW